MSKDDHRVTYQTNDRHSCFANKRESDSYPDFVCYSGQGPYKGALFFNTPERAVEVNFCPLCGKGRESHEPPKDEK